LPSQLRNDVFATANCLPPLPQIVGRLNHFFADPKYDLADVVEVLELDATLSGKLLKLAHSAASGQECVSSVRQAVMVLSEGTVRAVAIASSVRPQTSLDLSVFGLTVESYWLHSLAVMSISEALSELNVADFSQSLPTAALLHDFGKLVLSKHLTPAHVLALENLSPSLRSVDRETAILGVNHAEVTAVVTQAWHLPEELCLAVQYHHHPSDCGSALCHGLNLANQCARRMEDRKSHHDVDQRIQTESLAALAMTDEQLDAAFQIGVERFHAIRDCLG